MSDLFNKVTDSQDIFKKILSKIPGFNGYIERENRRASDKLLRETIANRYEEIWKRISGLQQEFISQGEISTIDDLESAAIKLRQFIDRVRTAAYGYSGLFDAIKVNENELALLYQYDLALVTMADEVDRGVDTIESSVGTDGLPAAIRNLNTLTKKCVEAFNKRAEVVLQDTNSASATGISQ
ncbi:MAG: hypothetical protein AB9891_19755 [Anaerolineaceae bacterium]